MQTRTAASRRPRLTEDIMPFSEYRGNLAACFDRVNETHRPLIVTRKGRADAVLVSAADFDPLMDVFLLADTVRKSRKEIAEGRGIDHKTAMRQFRERHRAPKSFRKLLLLPAESSAPTTHRHLRR